VDGGVSQAGRFDERTATAACATLAGIVIGAATVAVSAIIHLHLWLQGYKHIHTIGPLFLAQAVGGMRWRSSWCSIAGWSP